MSNNTICSIIGGFGCIVLSWSMGLMFFGNMSAIWGAIVGVLIAIIVLVNYD